MIYKVTIKSASKGLDWSRVFEFEDELCAVVDYQLGLYGLDDGHHFASIEDVVAANAVIAEITDDEFNDENYIEIEEITEELTNRIHHAVNQQLTDAELIGIGKLLNLIP